VGSHLEDVRSDLSAIHRIDDIEALPGPRFYALVYRLSAYPGLMQGRQRAQAAKRTAGRPTGPTEMTGRQWLASKPGIVEQISRTPLRRR